MRDTLRPKEYFNKGIAFKQQCIDEDRDTVNDVKLHSGRASQLDWLCARATALCIQQYSRGDGLEGMRPSVWQMGNMYGRRWQMMPQLDLTPEVREMRTMLILTNFHEALACLAFVISLRFSLTEQLSIIKFIDHVGEDGLLDRIAVLMGDKDRKVMPTSKFKLQYQPMVEVIDASADRRPALLKDYVEKWYKRGSQSAWHDTHKTDAYTGYWCFEAALVVMLLNIDDSAVRGHKHYPVDLVNFYKNNVTI